MKYDIYEIKTDEVNVYVKLRNDILFRTFKYRGVFPAVEYVLKNATKGDVLKINAEFTI